MSERAKRGLRRLLSGRAASAGAASVYQGLVKSGAATVGEGTYGEPEVFVWDDATRLSIGAYCSIARDVRIILGGEHRTDWVSTYPFRVLHDLPGAWEDGHPRTKADITIGNDVWIAIGAMILSGVTIGDGAVIGAGSVVSEDVPPYAIVAGNPARLIRYRFPEATRVALARIAWWRWPKEQVLEAVDLLCADDIDAFVERYDPERP